ncbi:hypothetical protein ENUP19_0378G0017 [Entamoeba nuttalli]|uniref:Uncharacterized protein n=2 Tax=Entamoeba nuttalli TaxID=412467 RepID=K2GEL5_ENTNP|nr:hypothetical protein ENU1_069360 [Entamoeba nuttalli P19]EKE41061.1 hypothetical protein ENU1_069360 [Entamoeba nuttalli P19]|eukprot:XP_008856613.1 hypothetical protein ENU1_069360 [Entamoeba nuttalli P19]
MSKPNNSSESTIDDFSYSTILVRLLSVKYDSFLSDLITSPESIQIKGIEQDNDYTKFQCHYQKLSNERKKELIDDFKVQRYLSDLASLPLEVSIKVSLQEYYNNTLRVIKVSSILKGTYQIKIPIGYDTPNSIFLDSITIKIDVQCPDNWECDGLDIIHYVSDEELQNRSFVFLSGKTLSLTRFNKEMIVPGYGLRSKKKGTGNLILKYKSIAPDCSSSSSCKTPTNTKSVNHQLNENSTITYTQKTNGNSDKPGSVEIKSGVSVYSPTNKNTDQDIIHLPDGAAIYEVSFLEKEVKEDNITYYIFHLRIAPCQLKINVHTDYRKEINNKECFKKATIKDNTVLYDVLFGGAFDTEKDAMKFLNAKLFKNLNLKHSLDNCKVGFGGGYAVLEKHYFETGYGFIPLVYPIPKMYEKPEYKFFVFFNYLHPSNEIYPVLVRKSETSY